MNRQWSCKRIPERKNAVLASSKSCDGTTTCLVNVSKSISVEALYPSGLWALTLRDTLHNLLFVESFSRIFISPTNRSIVSQIV